MENITLSLWIIAMALQITFLVALTAIAQTLRRSNGIAAHFGLLSSSVCIPWGSMLIRF